MSRPPHRGGNTAKSSAPAPVPSAPPSPEVTAHQLDRFLDLQSTEIGLRAKELDIRMRELDNAHKYSERALDAQVQDRDMERRHNRRAQYAFYGVVAFLFVLLAAVLCFSMYIGKDEIAKDVMKSVALILPSVIGGYYAGKAAAKKEEKAADG